MQIIHRCVVPGPNQYKSIAQYEEAEKAFMVQVAKAEAIEAGPLGAGSRTSEEATQSEVKQAISALATEFKGRLELNKKELQSRLNRPKLFGIGGLPARQ
jgi:hypothetical protein